MAEAAVFVGSFSPAAESVAQVFGFSSQLGQLRWLSLRAPPAVGRVSQVKRKSGPHRRASVVSSATGLVVSHDHRKPRSCLLCNSTSSDESPLGVTEEAALDMALPWRSYDKVKTADGDTVRVPSGKLCLICFNVYRALGTLVWPWSQVTVFVFAVNWA